MFYDPMIAKLITWGRTRDEAIGHMRRALASFEVVGPTTNVEFLGRLMRHEGFVAGQVDTGLIGRDAASLANGAYRTFEHASTAPLSYLRFDDFGVTAEDFARPREDWRRGWESAG